MSNCCIICYRLAPPSGSSGSLSKTNEGGDKDVSSVLERFFEMLERYLNEGPVGTRNVFFGKGRFPFPLDEVIGLGMTACSDCLPLIESFLEHYHKLKAIELVVNWKVNTLKNVMDSASKVPQRIKHIQESVKKVNVNVKKGNNQDDDDNGDSYKSKGNPTEIVNLVMESRRFLIEKCKQSRPIIQTIKFI